MWQVSAFLWQPCTLLKGPGNSPGECSIEQQGVVYDAKSSTTNISSLVTAMQIVTGLLAMGNLLSFKQIRVLNWVKTKMQKNVLESSDTLKLWQWVLKSIYGTCGYSEYRKILGLLICVACVNMCKPDRIKTYQSLTSSVQSTWEFLTLFSSM